MFRLLKYFKGYIKESVLGPLFKLLEATLELAVPLVIARIIDEGIAGSDHPYVIKMTLLLVLLGIVGLAFSVTAQYFAARAAVGFAGGVRRALFGKVQTLSYTDIDRLGVSTVITRMTADTGKVQNGVNLTLRLLLRSPFVVFGAMIMAFSIDLRSAISFAVVIPVLSVVVFGIMLITMPLYKQVQRGTDGILAKTRENLSGVRVIRAFRKEDEEIAEFGEKNDLLTRVQKRVGAISALMNPLTYVIINLAILLLIETGAIQVKEGVLTQGEVIALYNYMSQILVELIKLANLIISITKALASATRIADVLDTESTEVSGELTELPECDTAIAFKNVSLRYRGAGDDSLRGLSFTVGRGETLGVIGGTGSGKTSLINLIPGFYPATEGSVEIYGHNVNEYAPEVLRESIGIVPQRAVLFRGTVRDNLAWGDESAGEEEMYDALRTAQIYDGIMEKGGLDAPVEGEGRNFSGGQRQRLTVARALVRRPRILILDDSASALDYATDAAMRRAISEATSGSTVVVVSQRASSVMHADKIIVLEDGDAVGIGTHEELLSGCSVYREIYESQFGEGDNDG